MKCANCEDNALYEYKIVETRPIFYCGKHLPKFLDGLRRAGNLAVTEELTSNVEDALAVLETPSAKPKKKAAKSAEPAADEPVVEEPVVEAPVSE